MLLCLLLTCYSTTMAGSATRLWGYALRELAPITRQRVHLPDLATKTNAAHTSTNVTEIRPHRATLDRGTTRRLLDECSSRGVPLESALLASLFLAAAAAVSTAEKTRPAGSQAQPLGGEDSRGGGSGGDAGSSIPLGIRVQRASVLGIVSVVMALLSGSIDSKALRYLCSIYAVFAGKSPECANSSVLPASLNESFGPPYRLFSVRSSRSLSVAFAAIQTR